MAHEIHIQGTVYGTVKMGEFHLLTIDGVEGNFAWRRELCSIRYSSKSPAMRWVVYRIVGDRLVGYDHLALWNTSKDALAAMAAKHQRDSKMDALMAA